MQLTNKTVFITGGAGGLGTSYAQALLEKGANVVIADIIGTKGNDLVDEFTKEFGKDKAMFVKCDVGSLSSFQDAFKTAIDKYKTIDIMVNNAGILLETDLEKLLNVNLKGVIHGTELALAHMRKDKGGQGGVIINVASELGYTPVFIAPAYCASKHGSIAYTRSMACAPNLKQQGVRFACLCPAITDTPLVNGYSSSAFREEYQEITDRIMSQDKVNPKTVAEGLLTLIDDDDSNNSIMSITLKEGIARLKITVDAI